MFTLKQKVWWFALYSRLFIIALSAIFNLLLQDHAADAFVAPSTETVSESFCDTIVRYLLGGLLKWDSQYFFHIFSYGYTYENCLAFFPLFPLLTRGVAAVLYICLGSLLNRHSMFLIASFFLNTVCFVKSSTVLYTLSLRLLRNEKLAYKSAIFYCINPASIFFTAPYSETLFALCTFYGMLLCATGFEGKFSINCGLLFGLASVTRSNGIVHVGFIVYKYAKYVMSNIISTLPPEVYSLSFRIVFILPMILLMVGIAFIPYMLSVVLTLTPFCMFQLYAYYKFCFTSNNTLPEFLVSFAISNKLILPGEPSIINGINHWCNSTIPLSYSHVQSHYWGVGFLRYYQWKQIPNFLLVIPLIWIILTNSCKFLKNNAYYCLYLGLLDLSSNTKASKKIVSRHVSDKASLPVETFPYIVHALFLTIFGILFINVQVLTRLMSSSSPVLYWFAASMSTEGILKNSENIRKFHYHMIGVTGRKRNFQEYELEPVQNMDSRWKTFVTSKKPTSCKTQCLLYYFLTYTIVGTILFSNFYPWT